jgi:hypothetical protein
MIFFPTKRARTKRLEQAVHELSLAVDEHTLVSPIWTDAELSGLLRGRLSPVARMKLIRLLTDPAAASDCDHRARRSTPS